MYCMSPVYAAIGADGENPDYKVTNTEFLVYKS